MFRGEKVGSKRADGLTSGWGPEAGTPPGGQGGGGSSALVVEAEEK